MEFKKVSDTVPSSFYETVVSFSNCDGGIMLLGVEDSGAICGINPGASGKLQKEIIYLLSYIDCSVILKIPVNRILWKSLSLKEI